MPTCVRKNKKKSKNFSKTFKQPKNIFPIKNLITDDIIKEKNVIIFFADERNRKKNDFYFKFFVLQIYIRI